MTIEAFNGYQLAPQVIDEINNIKHQIDALRSSLVAPTFEQALDNVQPGNNASILAQIKLLEQRWSDIRAPYDRAIDRAGRRESDPEASL